MRQEGDSILGRINADSPTSTSILREALQLRHGPRFQREAQVVDAGAGVDVQELSSEDLGPGEARERLRARVDIRDAQLAIERHYAVRDRSKHLIHPRGGAALPREQPVL